MGKETLFQEISHALVEFESEKVAERLVAVRHRIKKVIILEKKSAY